jgi:hypothetical protein
MKLPVALFAVYLLSACATSSEPPSVAATPNVAARLSDAVAAVTAAQRLTTIHGPWTVEETRAGTYAELWDGSTNDTTGQQAAEFRANGARAAWRVLLVGPDGREELFLDRETGKLLSSVTQGD